jgi:hypothetical protein
MQVLASSADRLSHYCLWRVNVVNAQCQIWKNDDHGEIRLTPTKNRKAVALTPGSNLGIMFVELPVLRVPILSQLDAIL